MESTISTTWQRVLEDPHLRDLPYKVETNERDQIILSPHKNKHSLQQTRISRFLLDYMQEPGEPAVEFAIETRLGVKVPDVVWLSQAQLDALPEDSGACPFAPDICIEVLSRANTNAEMSGKRQLYFEAGAREVWLCDEAGAMVFYVAGQEAPVPASLLMPTFPQHIRAKG